MNTNVAYYYSKTFEMMNIIIIIFPFFRTNSINLLPTANHWALITDVYRKRNYMRQIVSIFIPFIYLPAITHISLQGLTSRCWHMLLREKLSSSSNTCYQIPLIPSLAEYCANNSIPSHRLGIIFIISSGYVSEWVCGNIE